MKSVFNRYVLYLCLHVLVVVGLNPTLAQGATVPTIQLSKKTFTVFSAAVSPGLVVKNDGESAQFQDLILPSKVTATEWSWDYAVPTGAGNSPACTFAPSNAKSTTIGNSKWYAYPNNPCTASDSSDYTIKSKVTLSGKQFDAETGILQVSVPWGRGGVTYLPSISGDPDIDSRLVNGVTEWYISGTGTLLRSTITVVINIPQTSQFHAKAVAHENKHVEDLTTGIGRDLWTVSELYSLFQELHAPTLEELQQMIANARSTYETNETKEAQGVYVQMERNAYAVSDPISPQYLYMKCDKF